MIGFIVVVNLEGGDEIVPFENIAVIYAKEFTLFGEKVRGTQIKLKVGGYVNSATPLVTIKEKLCILFNNR